MEHEDSSTCDPCDAVDGKLYRNREDAYADYPGGVGYKDCVGAQFGNSCRGLVRKRRGAERNDQGMTDTRLLAEFRNALAERDRILPTNAAPRAVKRGQDWFRIENVSATEATVYIHDEIGFWGTTAHDFVNQLNALNVQKITVEINSPGGDVFDGIAIHTALASSKAHVTTFVTGLAASAASYIAMAGDTIRMARNATMMIHDASGMVWGNATAMRQQADLLDKLTMNIADMYAMQAGGAADEWFARMNNTETWFTGKEALAAGLVDEITDADQEPDEDEQPTNRLTIAAFNYAGRAAAPAPELSEPETVETEQDTPGDAPAPEDDVATTMLALLAEQIRSGH